MVSPLPFQKATFFFGFFNKDYTFCTKKSIFYNERRPKYFKNPVFSNISTFLSVIHQNYGHNLRIFYNFRVKTQKSMECDFAFSKYYFFLDF